MNKNSLLHRLGKKMVICQDESLFELDRVCVIRNKFIYVTYIKHSILFIFSHCSKTVALERRWFTLRRKIPVFWFRWEALRIRSGREEQFFPAWFKGVRYFPGEFLVVQPQTK